MKHTMSWTVPPGLMAFSSFPSVLSPRSSQKTPEGAQPMGPRNPPTKLLGVSPWPWHALACTRQFSSCWLCPNCPSSNDDKIPDEPLLGFLPPVDSSLVDDYGPTVWGPEAYRVSFDKFFYAQPGDWARDYPEATRFADVQTIKHFSYLQDSIVIPIMATEKNQESTPAYPKMMEWASEEGFLQDKGWAPYVDAWRSVNEGARPNVCWYLFLKKEIIKQEKIDRSDIRQIVCSDPIFARIGCCFEQNQNQRMKEETEHSSGQCGWSPFGGGFERRMRRLLSKGNNYYVEFDWTRFDGTIPRSLFMRIKKIRWGFICSRDRERYGGAYRWYCKQLVHRHVVLPSGEVTVQNRGNPSGQISTTTDNNMVNYWLQAFEYYYFNGESAWDSWHRYDTLIYGDDRLNTTPTIPDSYVERVCAMYREIFGMWVKPEKVRVSNSIEGLSFCGFTVGPGLVPQPTQPYKMMASLLKPCSRLPDFNSLHGKLLCFQLLCHYLPEDHPFKWYLEECLEAVKARARGNGLPARFTEEQLERIWRGGPKVRDG
ncbi:nonstructural protein 1b [Marmot astrovirus]|nr:nonstructural protein 1b [Marmot astrovirus]